MTMAMTLEQNETLMLKLVEQLSKMAGASTTVEGTENSTGPKTEKPNEDWSPKLDLKNFTRMEKFSGGDSAWKEWSFDLRVLTVSICPVMGKWFHACENTKGTSTPEKMQDLYAREKIDPKDLEARSKRLFGILCLLTEGEAKTMIRGQSDGLAAYQLLHRTYEPR